MSSTSSFLLLELGWDADLILFSQISSSCRRSESLFASLALDAAYLLSLLVFSSSDWDTSAWSLQLEHSPWESTCQQVSSVRDFVVDRAELTLFVSFQNPSFSLEIQSPLLPSSLDSVPVEQVVVDSIW